MLENALITASPTVYLTEDLVDKARKALGDAGKAINKTSIMKWISKNSKLADTEIKKLGRRQSTAGQNKVVKGIAKKGAGAVSSTVGKLSSLASKGMKKIGGTGMAKDFKSVAKATGGAGSSMSRSGSIDTAKGMTQSVFGDFLQKNGIKAVGKIGVAVAAGAAAGILAHYVYKHYISAAGKKCKGKSGEEYKKCIANAKKTGLQKALGALRTAARKCGTDSNPAKCKAKYAKEIAKMQAKISKVKG
jgi:hypothetical protein